MRKQLVNVEVHLAAKKPDTFLEIGWKQSNGYIGLKFIRRPERKTAEECFCCSASAGCVDEYLLKSFHYLHVLNISYVQVKVALYHL